MIKKGTLCVWQNLKGRLAFLNDSDVTAMTGLQMISGFAENGRLTEALGYITDQPHPFHLGGRLAAYPHELREKFPPKDELDDKEKKPLTVTLQIEGIL